MNYPMPMNSMNAPQAVMSGDVASSYPQDFYDTIVVPSAGFTELQLFSLPQGQGQTAFDGAAAGGKTFFDTNMTNAGMIPSGKRLEVYGIGILYEPGMTPTTPQGFKGALPIQSINDTSPTATGTNIPLPAMETFRSLRNYHMQFTIGDKVICEGRLYRFPMPTDCRVDSSIATASSITGIRSTSNVITEGDVWSFGNRPLTIDPTVNFAVRIKSPTATPTLTGQNARITAYLFAQIVSAAQ